MMNWLMLIAVLSANLLRPGLVFGLTAEPQPPIDKTIVYIECTSADGQQTSKGTGVLVSRNGAILTARHVAPIGFTCMGVIGTAATRPTRKLIRNSRTVFVDAMLLNFSRMPNETFEFARYRRIDDKLRGSAIEVHGFPDTGAGDVFESDGIISQTNVDENGIIGTSALSSSGMSGGPVLLKQDHSLIGIVVGADFDKNTGTPSRFGVLAAQEVATILELQAISTKQENPNAEISARCSVIGQPPAPWSGVRADNRTSTPDR